MSSEIGIFQRMSMTLRKDPYWVGMQSYVTQFVWGKSFVGRSECGFSVRYTIKCRVEKIDLLQFRNAAMLDEENQQALVENWHKKIFLPTFSKSGYSFKFLSATVQTQVSNPCLCRQLMNDEGWETFWDFGEHELRREMNALPPLLRNGCSVSFCELHIESPEEQFRDGISIMENYNMLKLRGQHDPESRETFRHWEESCIVAMLHRRLELEREFQHIQATQKHTSDKITVRLRSVNGVVELSWELDSSTRGDIRGFRKENGFSTNSSSFSDNGLCIVESKSGTGTAVQNLKEGTEYFYSFFVTCEETEYAEQSFAEKVFSSPAVKGTRTVILDTLRFSVRTPSRSEMARVSVMLERVESLSAVKPDPKKEKIARALEELSSFVEFDESLTQWEKHFLEEIESKDYPRKVKADKVEKLKSMMEKLRLESSS